MVLFKFCNEFLALIYLDEFTFHYGPIQILSLSNIFFISFLFTFHYGPIQIKLIDTFTFTIPVFTFHYGPIQMVC